VGGGPKSGFVKFKITDLTKQYKFQQQIYNVFYFWLSKKFKSKHIEFIQI